MENTVTENNIIMKYVVLGIAALAALASISFFYVKPWYLRKHLPMPVTLAVNGQPTLGNPKAKIHLVVFEDLKCANCARFNNEVMPYLKKQYIDTGIAKYTLINLAFIPGSLPAANAAHCVYQQSNTLFFDYVDYIYHHQPPENKNWATIPALLNYANAIKGIDGDKLAQCLVNSPYDQFIQNNLTQA